MVAEDSLVDLGLAVDIVHHIPLMETAMEDLASRMTAPMVVPVEMVAVVVMAVLVVAEQEAHP